MKALKKDLQMVLKTLKSATRKTESLAKRMDKLEKAQKAKAKKAKKKAKVAKRAPVGKARKRSATDTVFSVIKRSRKGVDMTKLKAKTGFGEIKIRNIIFRLKKQGRIKTPRKGIYAPVG